MTDHPKSATDPRRSAPFVAVPATVERTTPSEPGHRGTETYQWRKARVAVLARAGGRCETLTSPLLQRCAAPAVAAVHVDPPDQDTYAQPANMRAVCASCLHAHYVAAGRRAHPQPHVEPPRRQWRKARVVVLVRAGGRCETLTGPLLQRCAAPAVAAVHVDPPDQDTYAQPANMRAVCASCLTAHSTASARRAAATARPGSDGPVAVTTTACSPAAIRLAARLDALGLPLDAGNVVVRRELRARGIPAGTRTIEAAIRHRRAHPTKAH